MTLETLALLLALALAAMAIYLWYRRRARIERHERIRAHFGSEYDHAVERHGDERRADESLEQRVERVKGFELQDLDGKARRRFQRHWDDIQKRFVDTPAAAVREAHDLVLGVMTARGYPEADLDQRIADMSVHHPALVHHVREAAAAARKARASEVGTEELRRAVIHYRALFDDLLEPPPEVAPVYRRELRSAEAH